MKLKEQKKFGILWLSIGAALFLAGLLLGETGYSSYISGFGGALMGVGAARLLRVRRLSRDPEKAADYDASLKDERTAYVANKARSMTFFICVYVQLAAALLADPGVQSAACRAGALRPDLPAEPALHRILLALQ